MTEFVRVITLALTLASTTWSSHPRDQYAARDEDGPRSPRLLTDAKDLPRGGSHRSHSSPSSIRKRSYEPWTGQLTYDVPYQSIAAWKPPVYQLSRPYYIPIYGIHGRVPIYFPPQPLQLNPGTPPDNPPKKPFKGPAYLPPVATTASPPETTMFVGNRNGGEEQLFDGRPVWDMSGGEDAKRRTTTTETSPTRRTRPPGGRTRPPLVHNLSEADNKIEQIFERPLVEQRPRPQTTRRPTTLQPTQSSRPNEPSRCVWAIISCCSSSGQISYDCFDQRGCPGAFWDSSPCDSEFARAAIAAALNYYQ